METTKDEEQVYDRQIRLWGIETQRRMRTSHILISGEFRGLGAEICKNLVLAGVNVTVNDSDSVCSQSDFESQFFLKSSSIGKNRAEESLDNIRLLNPMINAKAKEGDILLLLQSKNADDIAFVSSITLICVIGRSLDELSSIGDIAREKKIPFMAAGVRGLSGYLFNDFGIGYSYVVKKVQSNEKENNSSNSNGNNSNTDAKGESKEETVDIIDDDDDVAAVAESTNTKGNSSSIEILDDDDDVVVEESSKTTKNGNSSSADQQDSKRMKEDSSSSSTNMFTINFCSLKESLGANWKALSSSKRKRVPEVYFSLHAENLLLKSLKQSTLMNETGLTDDQKNIIKEQLTRAASTYGVPQIDSIANVGLVLDMVDIHVKRIEYSPICAVVGGIVAQEIIKRISQNDAPFDNWFFFDGYDSSAGVIRKIAP